MPWVYSSKCSMTSRASFPPGTGLGRVTRSLHDLTAARTHGIPAALTVDDNKCWADKAYQGASPAVRVPFRAKNLRSWRRRHNRDHAKIRSIGERAMATLK
ncbi:transposase family protein [Streptomyces sp. NPDC001523]|uniref:transposase family protein n=1 Tax=Streptomyces sp. NPDC001523 TaxID=3154383 RepID=UPI003324EEC4